ncbi:MAG: phage minor capsid protein [Clostridium sp.]
MPVNDYDIASAFQTIEKELIASMIRNMDRHRAEETKEGMEWSMWQTEQLKSLEKYKKGNQKKYNKQFSNINAQIVELIKTARETGNMEQEVSILNAIKNGFKGANKVSAGATAEFFRLNDRKLEALIKATTHDMQRAETAILRMAEDQYRKSIFNSQVYANSGAGTYEKAVDMATKDMLSRGLNCVEYKNGARHTLPDYADMAIRTASKRAYLTGEGEKRQEWGISTVIINKRGNPCPLCLPFVGKVMIDDVWSGGSKENNKYPLMSNAVAAGLYHPRCKDGHTTYFQGISTPPDDKFTVQEIEDIKSFTKEDVRKQNAQRQIARLARLTAYSLDESNKKMYKQRSIDIAKSDNTVIMKLSNKEVRDWYLNEIEKIPENIPMDASSTERAISAFEARNRIRTQARDMMKDETARKDLDQNRPNKTFEELIDSKIKRKGMTREQSIDDIYKTATKTNEDVNKMFGIGGDDNV